MDNGSAAQRSKQRRILYPQDVQCETEAGNFTRRSSDLSSGGMFVDSLTILPPNSLMKIRFRLPDSDKPIEVSARVLYVRENIGAGVQFLGMKPVDRDRIESLIDRVLENRQAFADVAASRRVLVDLPVNISWTEKDGKENQGMATIESLAKHGARIRTNQPIEANIAITLSLPDGSRADARVIWEYKGEAGIHSHGLAQALGITFPLD